MRAHRKRDDLRLAACALLLLAAVGCSTGGSGSGEEVASESTNAGSDRDSARRSDESRAGDVAVWQDLAPLLVNADEAEGFSSLEDMVGRADAVVVGQVTAIRKGRIVQTGPGVPALPFAEFRVDTIEVLGAEPGRQDDGSILIEVPFEPRSPELDAAIDAAIDDESLQPGASDEAYAAATDDEAIAKAYAELYVGAIDRTIEEMDANPPDALALFALRRQPPDIVDLPPSAYRLVNGSGVIAAVNGQATLPLRLEPREDLLADDVLGWSFDDVVAAARAARSG